MLFRSVDAQPGWLYWVDYVKDEEEKKTVKGYFNFSDDYDPDDPDCVAYISPEIILTNHEFDLYVVDCRETGERKKDD